MSTAGVAFRALVRKDLVTFLRDRRALVVSICTPIFIAAFFGFLFGGNDDGAAVSRVPVALVDEDQSALSRAVIEDLLGDAALAADRTTQDAARELVRTGKRRAGIILGPGFGAAAERALFRAADRPAVELLYDPSQSFVKPIIEGLLTQHVMQQVTKALFTAGGSTEIVDESLARVRGSTALTESTRRDLLDLLESVRRFQSRPSTSAAGPADRDAVGGLSVPFRIASTPMSTGPKYNSYAHSFAGMSVQFILFMGIDAGIALLMMREQGFWRRLRAAPLSRGLLLGSRVTATSLIALLILAVVYLAAFLLFGVRISGSVGGFIAVSVAFALLAATTGLMIAALGRSVGATRGLALLTVLMLVMLGGAWVPAFLFPEWLQTVSLAAPTRWAVDGLDAMTWRGLPATAAIMPAAVLLAWAIVFGSIAAWRFDWEK